jgi:hypothetical protein
MAKKQDLSSAQKQEVKEEVKKAIHDKVLTNVSTLRNEYKKQVSTAILTALGLVIALVWKDVITALIPTITAPGFLTEYPLVAQVYVAGIVTGIAILGILLISNWSKPKENK